MSVIHTEYKSTVADRINELAEQVFALKNAYSDELRARQATEVKLRNDNRKKLSKQEVGSIRRLYEDHEWTQADIAEAFDLNPATVSRIVRRVYHK